MNVWQCWCGAPKHHGGNKKLAAEHSAISKKKYEEERAKYPQLFEKPPRQHVPDSEHYVFANGKKVKVIT